MMRRFLIFTLCLVWLAGCANLPAFLSTPQPVTIPTDTPIPGITSTPTATPTVTPGGPRTLRIWLPPRFDPASETPAGILLQQRLDEFAAQHSNLQIEVRIKAESMLNSLSTTQAAAPSIMPDLVALSRTDLAAAAAVGLLHPLDGLSDLPDDPDWYPYARQMAHIKETAFGLPFAGDALTLVGYGTPSLTSWSEIPEETIFLLPATDPQAAFTISLYLSAGGTLTDDQGLPSIDGAILANILSLYQPSDERTFLAPVVTQLQNDEQTWNALREQRGNLAVSWVSTFLQNQSTLINIAPLPGFETAQYTLARGWSWALAGSNLENQPLAVELAEFLSDSQFLAEWSQAAGYLPTRPTALSSWEDAKFEVALMQTAESANLMPNQELRSVIGPLFTVATLSVINREQTPDAAAQSVVEGLK